MGETSNRARGRETRTWRDEGRERARMHTFRKSTLWIRYGADFGAHVGWLA